MSRLKVAVLHGGNSAERDVSLNSGRAVMAALERKGFEVVAIDPKLDDVVAVIKAQQCRAAFIALHGVGGEDGVMQGALENAGIKYTGSGVLASALAMDKLRSKQLWRGIGLNTADFVRLDADCDFAQVLEELGAKAMVKPATEGSSIGMCQANNAEELEQAFKAALPYCDDVMAEAWITGREFTVAVIAGEVMPVIELKTQAEFYDFHAKYHANDTLYLCPAPLSESETQTAQALALAAFNSLGCEGWGRVDLMQDASGEFFLLEVNTSPGMTDHSLVPMAAAKAGIEFDDLVAALIERTISGVSS